MRRIGLVDMDEDAKLKEQIRETIVTMPDYFAPYETIVDFISEEEFDREEMRRLYAIGLALGRSDRTWTKAPPGLDSEP